MPPLSQRLLAEWLGTFALVFAAVGSAMAGEGLLGQALANGLVLSVLVAAYAGVSGAHFNPAVTLAFCTVGRLAWRDAAPYCLTQMLAAAAAAYALAKLYAGTSGTTLAAGAALAAEATPAVTVVIGEALITLLLMVAIYGTMIDTRGAGGLAGAPAGGGAKIGAFGVGFAVATNILTLGPLTGASMNPARSFGPALVRGDFALHWCYWVGPIAGALAGAWLYETTLLRDAPHVEADQD
ncbi:MAG: aquaporin [Planctomycetota bacterium]